MSKLLRNSRTGRGEINGVPLHIGDEIIATITDKGKYCGVRDRFRIEGFYTDRVVLTLVYPGVDQRDTTWSMTYGQECERA